MLENRKNVVETDFVQNWIETMKPTGPTGPVK